MWDVPRFAEYHRYRIIITENVVDAYKWVLYDAWIKAMTDLGYNHLPLFLNSQFFPPTPQSRDRMYVVFWQKSLKAPDLIYRPPAYCDKCGKDVQAIQVWKNPAFKWGKYTQQYNYHCPVHGNIIQPYYYAASLDEVTAETLLQVMGSDYPAISFSRVLSKKSKLWKVYYSTAPGMITNDFEIKRHCMIVRKRING